MTVTFTNLRVPLTVSYDRVPELLTLLRDLEQAGAGNLLQAEIQIHVVGENADQIKAYLQGLFDLGAIDDYKHRDLINQVEALKQHYLK